MKKMLMIGAGLALVPMSVAAEPYTCEDLGYVFDKGGCLDETTMVRCPMNLDRVWCVGGEMCGKYPVKGAACNDGAKIERCNLTENMDQSSKRCKYESEDCNAGWEKGILNSVTGNTANCCKEGWDLNPTTGVCEEHVCNKIRYPYTTDDYTYADYAGEIETCRSGNVINFGYVSCNNMWQRGSSNAGDAGYYKCLCKRTDYDNGYVFPFDKSTFYTTFGSGRYGDYHMCADAENSYYGYEHCFRGYFMGTSNGKRNGVCSQNGSYNVSHSHPGDLSIYPDANKVSSNGYRCIYDDICTEENQNYEECNICMSKDAINWEGKSYLEIVSFGGARLVGAKNACPYQNQIFMGDSPNTGKTPSSYITTSAYGAYYGMCYRECEWGDKNCKPYEMVVRKGKPVGILLQDGRRVLAYKKAEVFNKNNRTVNGVEYPTGWDAATAMAKAYTPEGGICEVGSGCEAGKWRLPNSSDINYLIGRQSYHPDGMYNFATAIIYKGGQSLLMPYWSSVDGGNGTIWRYERWSNGRVDKNSELATYAYPMITMEYK